MILITSAQYITPGLVSEFGKLPPCMLPVQNKRLFEHQITLFSNNYMGGGIFISLPESYNILETDIKILESQNAEVIFVPDNLSLGESVVYCLNTINRYNEPLQILHGDTLFDKISLENNIVYTDIAEDNYNWDIANRDSKEVYTGYFSFFNQTLLIQSIVKNRYNFIKGVEDYNKHIILKRVRNNNWLDFGLVNSYYRSISKLTTQRVFNSLKATNYSITKYSKDSKKILAEARWFKNIPKEIKHYVPQCYNSGISENGEGFYEIEYYYLSSLANLFVFSQNPLFIWNDILKSCVEYIDLSYRYTSIIDKQNICIQNNSLYGPKTLQRIEQYATETDINLSKTWKINSVEVPSIKDMIKETDAMISKSDERFVSIMHGDFCFSNILYDFKSKNIKLIDPRGLDIQNNETIYGDIRYDVAKLGHSIIGMYDFIITGRYEYFEKDKYDITLSFETNNTINNIQQTFRQSRFAGYNIEDLNVYPIMIHLFLSMLPLHKDNPQRQKVLLANALRLYVELKNNKPKLNIIIPMAGLSSRFSQAGFSLPKYMLYVKDRSLFNLSVSSFKEYFKTANFIFVARDIYDTKTFIENECSVLGIDNYKIVLLNNTTKGQAETVLLGIQETGLSDYDNILIFNIDTFRPYFKLPDNISTIDGYLEVFKGSGNNWSYAKTENELSTKVVETAEKKEISNYCSTGIYYFKNVKDFINSYYDENYQKNKELYVAPLYNNLIKNNKDVHINLIQQDEVIFCGIPDEYTTYLKENLL